MYVSMSKEHSDDGLFDCSILDINSYQTKIFKVRLFVSDFATFIRGEIDRERERERERERDVLLETTSTYRIRIINF